MAQPFQMPVAKHQLVRETAEVIRATCREIIHRHLGPLAPLHVDLAVAVARENYAQAARQEILCQPKHELPQLCASSRASIPAKSACARPSASKLKLQEAIRATCWDATDTCG